jgi:hypothetical protein
MRVSFAIGIAPALLCIGVGAGGLLGYCRFGRTDPSFPGGEPFPPGAAEVAGDHGTTFVATAESGIAQACRAKAAWLVRQLGPSCATFVDPPFVVAGTVDAPALADICRRILKPTAEAFARELGDGASAASTATALGGSVNAVSVRNGPAQESSREGRSFRAAEPIAVLVFRDESHYRKVAKELFGEGDVSRFGFYVPHLRLILASHASGPCVLRHELVHALVDRSGRGIPAWLDEGLAALHEDAPSGQRESETPGAGSSRRATLQQALAEGRAPRLESLVAESGSLGHHDGVRSAYLRYFCMFLRAQGRLGAIYRRACDDGGGDAPVVPEVLLEGSRRVSPAQWEREFLDWLARGKAARLERVCDDP